MCKQIQESIKPALTLDDILLQIMEFMCKQIQESINTALEDIRRDTSKTNQGLQRLFIEKRVLATTLIRHQSHCRDELSSRLTRNVDPKHQEQICRQDPHPMKRLQDFGIKIDLP
ncbi:hypothetical protein AMTRI_Chr04g188110 [Amborella trichopoda]